MIHDQTDNKELDKLIHDVLSSDANLEIPARLSEKTIQQLEKRVLLRELLLELSLKVGLVLGSLAVLAGVFLWISNPFIQNIQTLLISNSKLITSLLLLAFITLLIDQVGIKYLSNSYLKITSHSRFS